MMKLVLMGASLALLAAGAVAMPAGPDVATGKATYAQCAACHAVTKGATGIGPTLYQVAGRKVAALPGFAYSPALKAKGGVWSDTALDAYLAAPQVAVPGNRMPYPGLKDAAKRAALIAYLKTLK